MLYLEVKRGKYELCSPQYNAKEMPSQVNHAVENILKM